MHKGVSKMSAKWIQRIIDKLFYKEVKPEEYSDLYLCDIKNRNWERVQYKILKRTKRNGPYTCYKDPFTGEKFYDDFRNKLFVTSSRLVNGGKPMTLSQIKQKETELLYEGDLS